MKKLAILFPGIGYHVDKPLLYYSKKLAVANGFEVMEVPYGNFPEGVKGSLQKMKEAFDSAVKQSECILQDVKFEQYDKILFISKSIGTAVAAAYATRHNLQTYNIFYTPVEASIDFMNQPGIVFHGTEDAWVDSKNLVALCQQKGYKVEITQKANHSLETGNVQTDLYNLKTIMTATEQYIGSI